MCECQLAAWPSKAPCALFCALYARINFTTLSISLACVLHNTPSHACCSLPIPLPRPTQTVQDVPEARADKVKARRKVLELDPKMRDLLVNNRLLARITSRPGQSGRADGQILEGEELDFYLKALNKKKGKKSA